MAAKAALALILMLCCASAALATYDSYNECSCDEDCHGDDQCKTYKCEHGQCKVYDKSNGCKCDDGNKCTTGDACYHGVCKGSPVKCYTKDQCKVAFCNAYTGTCKTKNKAEGSKCSDGQKCTYGDKCCSGVCKGTWKNCPNKSECTKTYCNPLTGKCKSDPINEGKPCDDHDDATCNDKCCNGVCKGTYKSYEPTYDEPSDDTYEKYHG